MGRPCPGLERTEDHADGRVDGGRSREAVAWVATYKSRDAEGWLGAFLLTYDASLAAGMGHAIRAFQGQVAGAWAGDRRIMTTSHSRCYHYQETGLAHEAALTMGEKWSAARSAEEAAQCAVVRELHGNPFRPRAIPAAWLS